MCRQARWRTKTANVFNVPPPSLAAPLGAAFYATAFAVACGCYSFAASDFSKL